MALISFTPLQDGVTGVNAAATNTPLSTIYNDYNGNITDANVSASAAIAFSKVSGGTSTALVAWASWTPSYVNITPGNGTVVAKYIQIGKTVHFKYKLTWGSTTSFSGAPTISLPVASTSDYDVNTGVLGFTSAFDTSAGTVFAAISNWASTTIFRPIGLDISNAQYNFSATSPMTWATGDVLYLMGSYEAA